MAQRKHIQAKLTATLFTALAVLVAVSVSADEQSILEMDLEQLLQVSITGSTLRQESIKTVPSSTTVYTHAQLEALGLDYLHELLNLVPGFQVTRSGDSPGSYSFSVRGRRQGGQSREVLLLVDGRVFTDPRSGGIESALHMFPLANIERLEIMRGPASAIYGSGAFSGVINIVSRQQIKQLKISLGDHAKRIADINFSGSAGEWQTDFYTHLATDDGQRYHIGNQYTYDPHRETLVDWNLKYRNTRVQAFYSEQEAEDFYALEKINNDYNNYWQIYRHLRADQELNPTDAWKINLALGHEYAEQELKGTLLPAGSLATNSQPASHAPLLTRGLLASEAYRFNVANDVNINELSSIQFGLEWQHQREIRARSYNNYDLAQWARREYPITWYGEIEHETIVGGEKSRAVSGIYAQWLYQLGEGTRLTLGLRHDHYESLDTRTSPRFALVHQLNERHTLKLFYSEAFRAPTFGETDLLNNPVLVGNPNLVSETVKSSELLWYGIWDQLTVGATVYHNQYENPITAGFMGTTRTYVNGSRQKNYGVSSRINWQINEYWMFNIQANSLHDLPDAYFREADSLGSMGVNYQYQQWNWNFSAVYQGKRGYQLNANQRAQLDAYWYGNTQLLYQLNRSTSVALAVKNVFDKSYATPAQGAGLIGGVPNRARETSIKINWQFQ